jgi:hypothetical protein
VCQAPWHSLAQMVILLTFLHFCLGTPFKKASKMYLKSKNISSFEKTLFALKSPLYRRYD